MNLNGLVADEYAIGVVEEDAVGGRIRGVSYSGKVPLHPAVCGFADFGSFPAASPVKQITLKITGLNLHCKSFY
jgi:hypothetical protein